MGFLSSVAGNLVGGTLGLLGQVSANNTNKGLASANQAFQAYMSNTSHQREVADLRAAGLNPILSATGGNGASTPVGSVAQVSNVAEPARQSIESAINSAISYLNYENNAKSVANSIKTGLEQQKNLASSTKVNQENAKLAQENAKLAASKSATEIAQQYYLASLAQQAQTSSAYNVANTDYLREKIKTAPYQRHYVERQTQQIRNDDINKTWGNFGFGIGRNLGVPLFRWLEAVTNSNGQSAIQQLDNWKFRLGGK